MSLTFRREKNTRKFRSEAIDPLYQVILDRPHLIKSVVERNGFTLDELNDYNVLILHAQPHARLGEDGYHPRTVTMAIIIPKQEPNMNAASTFINVAAIGTSVKEPRDEDNQDVGVDVALASAIKDLRRRTE